MLEDYKRILFYLADTNGCGYYRIIMPSSKIEKYGFEYIINIAMIKEELGWPAFSNKGGICVLQRQYGPNNYKNALAIKKSGIKLVFEIDDYLHSVDMKSPAYSFYRTQSKVFKDIKKFYKLCDAITVSTEPLREKLLPYNKNIYVVPNSFVLEDWEIEKPKHNSINILWSGSPTHYSDLYETGAAHAVREIIKKYKNVKLITAGWDCADLFSDIPGYRRIHYPWNYDIKSISKFYKLADIGIAPIDCNEFNECKSCNKWVEYALTDTATIASKFGPYTIIKNEEDGLLVKNRFDKWYKAIERLVLDAELRNKIKYNAKKRCREEFNIDKNIENWVKVYNKVIGLDEMDGILNKYD